MIYIVCVFFLGFFDWCKVELCKEVYYIDWFVGFWVWSEFYNSSSYLKLYKGIIIGFYLMMFINWESLVDDLMYMFL